MQQFFAITPEIFTYFLRDTCRFTYQLLCIWESFSSVAHLTSHYLQRSTVKHLNVRCKAETNLLKATRVCEGVGKSCLLYFAL